MRELKQSTAADVMVFMTDSTDHVSGKTGLTLTITASKDGGAFGSITPTVTERGDGWYSLALTTGHTDTLGDLALHITGSGADPSDVLMRVIAMDKMVANTPADVQASSTAQREAFADALLTRDVANVEATAPDHSLCTVVLAMLESDLETTPGTLIIKRTDGTTTHVTRTAASDPTADPIVKLSQP